MTEMTKRTEITTEKRSERRKTKVSSLDILRSSSFTPFLRCDLRFLRALRKLD